MNLLLRFSKFCRLVGISALLLCSSFIAKSQTDTANIVLQDASEEVHYELTPGTQFVHVRQFTIKEYKALKRPATITVSDNYDNLKRIDRVEYSINGRRQRHLTPEYAQRGDTNAAYSDKRICYFEVPFAKKGSQAKVKWTATIQDPRYHNRIDFLDDFFTEKKTISVAVPAWLDLDIEEHNLLSYDMELQKEVKDDEIIWTYSIRNAQSAKSVLDLTGNDLDLPYLLLVVKNVQ
ncbi:MAG: hypothetical protein ABI378_06985 [Chitinophagaceae bacterium]